MSDAAERLALGAARLIRARAPSAPRLILRVQGNLTFLDLQEIDWIEADGNNLRVHAGMDLFVVRQTLKNVEDRLDGRFLRVHRSAIVNSDRIRQIVSDPPGHVSIVLRNGTRVPAGRYIDATLREWMDSAC